MLHLAEYLQPSGLCDFDAEDCIREKAVEVTRGAQSPREKALRILHQVQHGIPYALDEWDVKASQTLKKGYGMCMNKTNLAVAELRSIAIPARYRLVLIRRNEWFESVVTRGDEELAQMYHSLPENIQHVLCEVYLEGQWEDFDVSRDEALEKSFQLLGIPQERIIVADLGVLASPDEFVLTRSKHITHNREEFFRKVNQRLADIRKTTSSS